MVFSRRSLFTSGTDSALGAGCSHVSLYITPASERRELELELELELDRTE